VRAAYEKYLGRLCKTHKQAAVIMRIETELAKVSMTKEDLRDVDKVYHKLPLAKLAKLTPRIDWREYFKILGASPREVIVMQPGSSRRLSTYLKRIQSPSGRYICARTLSGSMASYLTPSLERESFAFYGTVMSGTKHMKPLWRRVLSVVGGHLGEPLGRIYIKRTLRAGGKKENSSRR